MKAVALDIVTGEEIPLSSSHHVVFGEGQDRITVMVRDGMVEISAERALLVLPVAANQVRVSRHRAPEAA